MDRQTQREFPTSSLPRFSHSHPFVQAFPCVFRRSFASKVPRVFWADVFDTHPYSSIHPNPPSSLRSSGRAALFVITHTTAFIQSEATLKPKIGFEIQLAWQSDSTSNRSNFVHSGKHNTCQIYSHKKRQNGGESRVFHSTEGVVISFRCQK